MRITREVIEAKSITLNAEWAIEHKEPCVLHGREVDEIFFIKNFVPWAKTPAIGQTIYEWACCRMLANEIRKEIDREILEALCKI